MAVTAHVYQTFIRATPEQVWQAITDPAWTQRYFHGTAPEAPFVAGQPYRTTVVAAGRPAVEGVIEELDPPRRLVQTWRVLDDEAMSAEPPSRVTWEIDPVGDGLTRVRLVHGDLARSPRTWASVKDGWAWVLDAMKTLIETGSTLPSLDPAALVAVAEPVEAWHRTQAIEANNSVWDLLDARARRRRRRGARPPGVRRGVPLGPRRRARPGERSAGGVHDRQGPAGRRPAGAGARRRRPLHGAVPRPRHRRLRPGLRPRGPGAGAARARAHRRGGRRVAGRARRADRRPGGPGDPRRRPRRAAGEPAPPLDGGGGPR